MYIIIIYLHDTIARYMLQLNLLISIVAIKCHFDYFPFCEILKLIESLLQYLEYLFFTFFLLFMLKRMLKNVIIYNVLNFLIFTMLYIYVCSSRYSFTACYLRLYFLNSYICN